MSSFAVLGAVVVIVLLAVVALAVVRTRRRAALVTRLAELMRDLGMVIGRQTTAPSSFEGVQGRAIVLTLEGKRLELDLLAALEIQGEPDIARRHQRLQWLVDQARIAQGV